MPMTGRKKHIDRLRKLSGNDVIRVCGQAAFEGANTIRAEAFRLVSAGSVEGKNHAPSRPGEPPNRETGDLQSGFETQQTGRTTAEFRSEAAHGRPLEFGTSRMAARPHVRPARDNKLKQVNERFAELMAKLVKRSG